MRELSLGSLFDGAGGFPFAGQQCGIRPVWASEIERFPIQVTSKRFPNMKHLGDVTKINGAEIEPVDIITFGSPCQDLSVAGKQAGLSGERSGLFMEAIRIIKEMREATNGEYPTFAVWENVPGAFSSRKGEDFRTVLEEFCKIKDGDAAVPRPPKGKWSDAGEIVGDGYSVGWRVLDAQFWGVPQRRRRIFLVGDFRGGRAGKILFKRDGLQRSFAESRESWQGITKSLAFGSGDTSRCYCLQGNGIDRADTAGCNGRGWREDICYTLNTIDRPAVVFAVENHPADSRVSIDNSGQCQMLTSRMGTGGGNVPMVLCVRERCGCEGGGKGCLIQNNVSGTIATNNDQFLCIALDRSAYNQGQNAQFDMGIDEDGTAFTVIAKGSGLVCYCRATDLYNANFTDQVGCSLRAKSNDCTHGPTILIITPNDLYIRRLTPTESGRLQGMPDWWCDDIPHSDSAEYKMWGNGMALPCVLYVMEGIAKELKETRK